MANNSTNKTEFKGWSGFKDLLSGNTPYSSFANKPLQTSTPNPSLTVGPVNITVTPKNGPSRTKSSEPVYKTGVTQTQSVSGRRSVNIPQGLNLPYTAGTVDYSFPAGGGFFEDGFNGAVYHIAVDANGKYVVGGGFTNYYYNGNTYTFNRIIRLNTDGTVDESFDIAFNEDCYGGGFNDTVYTLEIQSDGKILVGGDFTQFDRDGNCNTFNNIIRLNSDGSRDTTFNIGNGFNGPVYDIHVQPDGKILVGGDFYEYNGTVAYKIIRLNSNGSIDSSFLIGDDNVLFNNYVNVIELQSDGKILVGGYFTTYGNVSQNYITRLNTNGTLDTTFQIGNGFNDEVMTLALQSDGKIIVGGYFNEFDNNDLFYGKIVRLDSNGSLDTLFGYGLNNQVHSLAIQSDDKILVGGYFGTYIIDNANVVSVDELVRFNSDCSFDYSFYYGEMLNDGVEYISILEDGNVLIGGFFNNFGNDPLVYPLNYFGRLHNAILEYPYTYVVEDCQTPLTSSPIYYTVGSNVPLSINDAFSFKKLSNPSVTVCGTLTDIYPSMNIDYELISIYNNCDSALFANAKVAVTSDMLDFGEGYNLLVDSKYVIGDILYVDLVFDFIGGPAFIKTVVKIDNFAPVVGPPGYFSSAIIPYKPYESVTEAVITNGIHYEVKDTCETDSISHYPLIHKEWYNNTSILLPSFGTIPCKEVVNVLTFAPYFLISGGTEELFSVVEFTDCDECLTKMGKTGVLDTTLYNNDFNGFVYTMVEQPDGKILVGGNFNEVNSIVRGSLVRLNSDGTVDETLNQVYCNEPVWSTKTPFVGTASGSIYFDGTPLCKLSVNTDQNVWDLGNNNVTFEWFQYFTGDLSHGLNPTAFDYLSNDLRVYFSQGYVTVVIDGDDYSYPLNTTINDVWCHIAVTRYYDPEEDLYIWRVFQNGIQLGQFNYSFSFNQNDPLLIGNTSNPYSNRGFKGYITNFRVNNGNAIYTENFTVPTEPLNPNYTPGNTVLCLSVNNEADYILDNCDDEIPTSVNSPDYFTNVGFDSYIRAIALQDDGKILVGGNFNYYNNSLAGKIIRLNPDGSIDNSFTFGNEFNGTVRAIGVQTDGKIVVGGDFNYYYGYYCNHIIRLNSDGTPDETFVTGDGFDGSVFTLNIEPSYNPHSDWGLPVYDTIIIGGWFDNYNNTESRGVAHLSHTGELLNTFGVGFNYGDGGTPRVNQILKQADGKLVFVGGADGGNLIDYQGTNTSRNIIRLVNNTMGQFIIDETFNVPPFYYGEGGFNNGNSLSITQQSDGKLIVGGNFYQYIDNNGVHNNLYNIVRLNTDGSYDSTFSMGEGFGGQVNKVLLLSDGKLLTGGRYSNPEPTDYLTRLYIGEEYKLYEFTECNGDLGYTYLPNTFSGSTGMNNVFSATPITYELISTDGLDLIFDGNNDDDNYPVTFPTPFDITFLGTNYTSVNVSTNPYITFGDGGNPDACCFDIPNQIPSDVSLPGVFVSFQCDIPHSPGDYDSDLLQLYTGLTDGGNTLVIKYFGRDHCNDVKLINYTYRFYKDNSDYFDLLIDENTLFFNDDPTGGVSNGVDETWITTFNSAGGNAYRIGYSPNSTSIKANLDVTPTFCGVVGSETNVLIKTGGQGGSMYFDGTDGNVVTVDYNVAMDLDYDSWTIEWFQYYTSTDTCCSRVFDIGSFPNEHIGVSLENGSIVVWIERPSGYQFSYTLNDAIFNTWSHFAISSEDIGGNQRRIRVFQNGVELGSFQIITVDMNNFDGPTLLPLIIGGMGNGQNAFQGYITNFRWNKGTCYYTSNFNVPTTPLTVDGSELLLLATNSTDLIYDSSETQTVNQNNVTWSELNPFGTMVNLFSSDGLNSYVDCDTCTSTMLYKATTLVRSLTNTPYVQRMLLTKNDIDNINNNGPIFTFIMAPNMEQSPLAYELLNYYL